MKAEELRIGNWVECFDKHVQIDGMKRGSIGTFSVEICEKRPSGCSWCELVPIDSLSLKPIPITEKWLLKFGFEKTEKRTWELSQIGNDIDLCISLNDGKGTAILWQADPIYIQNIDNVHQLQNLFFALTGEELKIKL